MVTQVPHFWNETIDEVESTPNDGRRLAAVSMGLAIGGIVVPIVLSIASIITAQIAKKRLGRDASTRTSRSVANTAQVFSVIDMCGYVLVITLFVRGVF